MRARAIRDVVSGNSIIQQGYEYDICISPYNNEYCVMVNNKGSLIRLFYKTFAGFESDWKLKDNTTRYMTPQDLISK